MARDQGNKGRVLSPSAGYGMSRAGGRVGKPIFHLALDLRRCSPPPPTLQLYCFKAKMKSIQSKQFEIEFTVAQLMTNIISTIRTKVKDTSEMLLILQSFRQFFKHIILVPDADTKASLMYITSISFTQIFHRYTLTFDHITHFMQPRDVVLLMSVKYRACDF